MAQLPYLVKEKWTKDPFSEVKHMGAYKPREFIEHYYKNYGTGGFNEALRHREAAQRKGQASRAVEGNEWLDQFPSVQPDYNKPIDILAFSNKALDEPYPLIFGPFKPDPTLTDEQNDKIWSDREQVEAIAELQDKERKQKRLSGLQVPGAGVFAAAGPNRVSDYVGIFTGELGGNGIPMSSLDEALRTFSDSKARDVVEHEVGHAAWGNTYNNDYDKDILGGNEWTFKAQEMDQWLADAKRKWVSSDKYKHDGPWNEEDSKDALKEYLQPNRNDKGSEIYQDIQNSNDFEKNFEKLTPLFLQRMQEVVQTDSPDKEVYA